jgi:hypothetical protein
LPGISQLPSSAGEAAAAGTAWLAPGKGALTIGEEERVEELRLQAESATQAVDRIATENALDTRRITPP